MTETFVAQPPVTPPVRSPGRIVRSVAGYALGTTIMLFLFPPAFVFVPALLFHCALRNGRWAAWVSFAITVLLVAPYLMVLITNPAAAHMDKLSDVRLELALVGGLLLGICVPALLALPLVERAVSLGRVLMFSLAIAVAGLALTQFGLHRLAGFSPFAEQLSRSNDIATQLADFYQKNGVPIDLPTMHRAMSFAEFILPASFIIEIAMVFVLSLVMLGHLRAWRERAVRVDDSSRALGTYLFRNFALPDWVLFAFVAGGLTPFLSGDLQKIAANVLAVVVFLYLLQGLAVARSLLITAASAIPKIYLAVVVVLAISMIPLALFTLGLAGLFDPFFDFRHFKRKDDSHESHTD